MTLVFLFLYTPSIFLFVAQRSLTSASVVEQVVILLRAVAVALPEIVVLVFIVRHRRRRILTHPLMLLPIFGTTPPELPLAMRSMTVDGSADCRRQCGGRSHDARCDHRGRQSVFGEKIYIDQHVYKSRGLLNSKELFFRV